MKILKSILSESKEYYLDVKNKIEKKLVKIPKGNIKKRTINNRIYYYLQFRKNNKIIQKYLGKDNPKELSLQIKERNKLKVELKKVNEALKIIKRSEGRKSW